MLYLRPRRDEPDKGAAPDWPRRFAALAGQARNPDLRAYYQAGVIAGIVPLAKVPFVALDFETTGLNPEKHGIVSIGLIPFDLKRIRPSRARHWVVRPRKPLVDESVVFHGITHSDISKAPDLSEIIGDLLRALAGRIVVVHHRAIERRFLDTALRERIGEGIEFPTVDTMELEARIHRQKPPGVIAQIMRRSPPSIRLADSRKRYRLPYYQPHHALTDALATAELFQAQVADRFTPNTPLAKLWH